MKQLTAILIGAGLRGNTYSAYALTHPDELRIVGVAEPDAVRRVQYKEKFDLPDERCFSTWQEVFAKGKWADMVMICTQDSMHYEPCMAAIEKGYDILLEKPISPSYAECKEIADTAHEKNVKVVVCHVMRYTPIFAEIKKIADSGEIGKIMTIVHNENVGDFHHAHSFVRGNWRNSKESSPMILAKSCHDLDFLQWLVGKKCLRLSSFGSLSYFTKENCPAGAPPRCTDGCEIDCPYHAYKMYVLGGSDWLRSASAGKANPSDEEVLKAIKTGPYGRCVYQIDNDVVDHQVVSMEFEGNVTAIFSMTAFTADTSRSIKIMGTKGEIKAHTESDCITVTKFMPFPHKKSREVLIEIPPDDHHYGGDMGLMKSFCAYLRDESSQTGISEARISAQNHLYCFAAEKSRLNNGMVIEIATDL